MTYFKRIEEMSAYDNSLWWPVYGDPTPLFNWEYYNKPFNEHLASSESGEVGKYAFANSLVLIDKKGCIRGVSGAKKDSDIRNFFDLLKILKKEEFDQNWEENHPKS